MTKPWSAPNPAKDAILADYHPSGRYMPMQGGSNTQRKLIALPHAVFLERLDQYYDRISYRTIWYGSTATGMQLKRAVLPPWEYFARYEAGPDTSHMRPIQCP